MDEMFSELLIFPSSNPQDIVVYDNVWADMSEKAGNTPRERDTDILCLYISLYEKEKTINSYYVTETNDNFKRLSAMIKINRMLEETKIK